MKLETNFICSLNSYIPQEKPEVFFVYVHSWDLSIITQIVEPLMLSVQRTVEQGLDECELNLASVCSPEVIARLQRILPNGTERVYQVDPMEGPEACLRQAQEDIEQEYNVTDVHNGITCDGCEMSPIRGNRWK